jgi:hypothetical protein
VSPPRAAEQAARPTVIPTGHWLPRRFAACQRDRRHRDEPHPTRERGAFSDRCLAGGPATWAWSIENGLHWVRDVTLPRTPPGSDPGPPAGHGLLAQPGHGVLCRAGPVNLAAALRFHSRDPHRPLATLGISFGVGIPSQLPGDDARAAPDSATSKPTWLAERRAGGMLRPQTSGTQPSPTLPGRAIPEQPGNLGGLLP